MAQADSDDAVAWVVLAFDGDLSRLNARNHMLFDLAHPQRPARCRPTPRRMYVWDAQAPVRRSVIVSSRSDRIRKIVVGPVAASPPTGATTSVMSAPTSSGTFGEPSEMTSRTYMTDADSTQGPCRGLLRAGTAVLIRRGACVVMPLLSLW